MGYGVIRVDTSATLIIADNTKRQLLWITNTSENSIVYIGPDASITSAIAGVPLYQTQALEIKKDFGDWKGSVYGISGNTGGAKVFYWEVEL